MKCIYYFLINVKNLTQILKTGKNKKILKIKFIA